MRGSLSKQVIAKYDLSAGREPAEIRARHEGDLGDRPREAPRGHGHPHDGLAAGPERRAAESFIYHLENNQVYVGFVVHLNYENPYLYPYMEFQRFKHHPMVADLLKGGKRVAYGARAITEGGWQSMPKMVAPGRGACWAARPASSTCRASRATTTRCCRARPRPRPRMRRSRPGRSGDELTAYETEVRTGAIGARPEAGAQRQAALVELRAGRLADAGRVRHVDEQPLRPVALRHAEARQVRRGGDRARRKDFKPIDYPKPDGVLSFDRLTNVGLQLHQPRGEPARAPEAEGPVDPDRGEPAASTPSPRSATARRGSTRWWREAGKDPRFVINFQNCVHCKTCDIKDPSQNIVWTTPQGGDGPNYPNM